MADWRFASTLRATADALEPDELAVRRALRPPTRHRSAPWMPLVAAVGAFAAVLTASLGPAGSTSAHAADAPTCSTEHDWLYELADCPIETDPALR